MPQLIILPGRVASWMHRVPDASVRHLARCPLCTDLLLNLHFWVKASWIRVLQLFCPLSLLPSVPFKRASARRQLRPAALFCFSFAFGRAALVVLKA